MIRDTLTPAEFGELCLNMAARQVEVARSSEFPLHPCPCIACAVARRHDKRDAELMLRATRIAGAGVSPAERVRWDEYVEESAQWRERVRRVSHASA